MLEYVTYPVVVEGFYDVTPDHQPVIGPVSEHDGLWVAAGFSGHGFMIAPAVGRIVAEARARPTLRLRARVLRARPVRARQPASGASDRLNAPCPSSSVHVQGGITCIGRPITTPRSAGRTRGAGHARARRGSGVRAQPGASKQTAAAGTLVVDTSFVVQTIDPQRMFEPTSQIAVKGMYDTLLTFRGGSTQPLPWLARSWKVSKDAKTITFNLRRDARFSDGSRRDVGRRRLLVPPGDQPEGLAVVPARGREGLGPERVHGRSPFQRRRTRRSCGSCRTPRSGIVNSKLVKANGGTDAVGADKKDKAEPFLLRTSAGSGPYVLKSYSNKTQIILEANPRFWGPKPKFQTVVLRNMPAATQLLNVQRGENEVALDLSAQQATTLRGRSGVRVVTNASANLFNIDINTDPKIAPVASNKNIQTAIRYALDYAAFVKLSGPGAVQAPGMIPTTLHGAPAAVGPDQAEPREGARRGGQVRDRQSEDHDDVSVRAHDQRHLLRDARPEDEGEPRRGRDRGHAGRQAGQRVPRDVRRRQARDEPVVLGPGLSGPERLPRLHARRPRREPRQLGRLRRPRSSRRWPRRRSGRSATPSGRRCSGRSAGS